MKKIFGNPYDPEKNPNGVINLGTAENYCMLDAVTEFANTHSGNFTTLDLNYGEGPCGTARLRKGMAKHMNKYFNPLVPVDPENFIFATGCTSLFEMLGFALAEPGDGIILSRPCYQAFEIDFGWRAKLVPVFTPFDNTDQFAPSCIPYYERAIEKAKSSGITPRMLMLCNPHNPLGQCYPRATLIGLMQLCQKHKIHFLSDEIYALSVYSSSTGSNNVPGSEIEAQKEKEIAKAVPFESVLAFDTKDFISSEYLHVLYGFSKDLAAGGMRLGCVHSASSALKQALRAQGAFAWSANLSSKIAEQMLEDEVWMEGFLNESRRMLGERSKLCRSLLEEKGVRYGKGACAGFFLWVDLTVFLGAGEGEGLEKKKEREKELVEKMLGEGVYLTSGTGMMAEDAGWFRLVFSQDEAVLRKGLERLWRVLGIEEKVAKGEEKVLPVRSA
ncbi:aminotransferase [Aulographum hederae CBS 113979]|uniref:Aminotransferase n=1 Tax=Aulographum hederae CBS 113979 TaxID=1176131 RepID=A0A6G1HFD8_9PEZI|nr:aminotransferase [Aulographum hederae CBS 113979]